MRITGLTIAANDIVQNGLQDISLTGLSRVVVIAGKNGSGKSRFLDKLELAIRNTPTQQRVTELQSVIKNLEARRGPFAKGLADSEAALLRNNADAPAIATRIKEYKQNLAEIDGELLECRRVVTSIFADIEGDDAKRSVVRFVPKTIKLENSGNMSRANITLRANGTVNATMDEMAIFVTAQAVDVLARYLRATHPESTMSKAERDKATDDHGRLQSLIFDLVGGRVSDGGNGDPLIFGRPISDCGLSDGQSILLQLAVAIYAKGSSIRDSIIILDEPENHLHPAALLDYVDRVSSLVTNGQVWIATHSLSLIAHLADNAVVLYAEGGKVTPHGKAERLVLGSLLGHDAHVEQLRRYLDAPEAAALYEYAATALTAPTAIETGHGDPQMGQISSVLNRLRVSGGGRLKVLDYGVGKGRLFAFLAESGAIGAEAGSVDYYGVERDGSDLDRAKQIIGVNRVFGGLDSLYESHNPESFDVVVMCNTLHEIDPIQWGTLFSSSGIPKTLKDGGYLLLVENQRMRVGENAHQFGFIVLETAGLKDLFGIRGDEPSILAASSPAGSLKAHLISKQSLLRCTRATVLDSLKAHQNRAAQEIRQYRENQGTVVGTQKAHMEFAFWIHQHSNTTMALSVLGPP